VLPFAGLDYDGAHLAFRLISLAALAAGVVAIARMLGHSPTTALLMLALVSLAFRPLKASIQVGQVNEVQLAGIALYLWLSAAVDGSRRQVVAGALLAALVLFKPNLAAALPLLAVAWALGGRRRKLALQAAGATAGGLLALVITTAVFGSPRAWWDWLDFLRAFPPEKIPLRFGNVGLARVVYETMGLRLALPLTLLSLGIALACLWAGRSRGAGAAAQDPARTVVEDTTALGAGCLVYLVSAPLVWDHYLLLALPAALVLLRDPGEPGNRYDWRRWLVAAALLGIAADPLTRLAQAYDMRAQAALNIAGVLLLFGLTSVEWARPRP
jgi:hypothetical protein